MALYAAVQLETETVYAIAASKDAAYEGAKVEVDSDENGRPNMKGIVVVPCSYEAFEELDQNGWVSRNPKLVVNAFGVEVRR